MVEGHPYPIPGPMVILGLEGERHRQLTEEESLVYWLEPPRRDGGLPILRVGDQRSGRRKSAREDLIDQGVLVDLDRAPFKSEVEQAGYRLPATMTREVWDRYVEPAYEVDPAGHEALVRILDISWMSRQVPTMQPISQAGAFEVGVAGHGVVTLLFSVQACDEDPYILISDPPLGWEAPDWDLGEESGE